ncbi:MAG TPA: hypothetical protein ENK26_03785, partial [Gammaproteobacteria bacterium]|nr:hypothetical protein [Gammaproteobacteria bacterium]
MKYPKVKLLAAMISSALLVAGCGGGSGSNPSTSDIDDNMPNAGSTDGAGNSDGGDDTPTGNINPYSGSSTISGGISLSSLTGSDASAVTGGSQQGKRQFRSAPRPFAGEEENAIIKLYAVGANGELEDTGIDCQFDGGKDANGDPSYVCDGVADGKNYVVKYLRLLDDDKALEMRVNVKIPEGADKVPAEDISPRSTVIVEAVVNAILSATEGKDIDPAVVDDIISSVKKVVENLVESGAVRVPSMVVDAPKDKKGNVIRDIGRLKSEDKIKFGENESLDSTTGALLSDEDVSREVEVARAEVEVHDLQKSEADGDEGKRRLIRKIFKKLLDGDVPEFLVDFFGDRYIAGDKRDVATLFDAIVRGMSIRPEFGVNLDDLDLSAEDAMGSLQALLEEGYRLRGLKEQGVELNDEEKRTLANIPAVIQAVFPASDRQGRAAKSDAELTVPQGIVFTIYVTDKYVAEKFAEKTGKALESLVTVDKSDRGMSVEFDNPVDFDPMAFDPENPGLLQLYGFFDESNLAALDGYEISHLDIFPDKIWIPNPEGNPGGRDLDSLRAHVCVSDLSALARQSGGSDGAGLGVDLVYPTRSGERKLIALSDEADLFNPIGPGPVGEGAPGADGPQFERCFVLDPWAQANAKYDGSRGEPVQPALEDIVSDFVSGKYTVKVHDANGNVVAERDFKRKVIVGMQNAAPQLVSPRGMPQWPQECQNTPSCPQWDAILQQWNADGGTTTFALNIDTDDDGVDDKAKVALSWTKPKVDLPEGVRVAYSIDVSKNSRGGSESFDRWENVFSSHEKGRRLFGLSFTLPKLLDKLEAGEGSYNANVCAEFIDTDTGDFLGRGGCGFAEFHVGEPIDPNATFSIVGKGPVSEKGDWKVALIAEEVDFSRDPAKAGPPKRTMVVVSTVDSDGNYALTPTIGDLLGASPTTHFQLILFRDLNGDDIAQAGPEEFEPQFWPDWKDNIFFDTWGGTLRVISERGSDDGKSDRRRHEVVITGGEEVEGPDFS